MEGLLGRAWDLGLRVVSNLSTPKSPEEPIEIPASELARHYELLERGSCCSVYKQLARPNTVHVVLSPAGSSKCMSIYRVPLVQKEEALSVRTRFEDQSLLFDLMDSRQDQFAEIVSVIHSRRAWQTVHYASQLGLLDYFKTVADDPNFINLLQTPCTPEGMCSVDLACRGGHEAVVRFVLSRGADPAKKDPNGQNALHHASMSGSVPVIQVFSRHPKLSGLLMEKNDLGLTPVSLALRRQDPSALRVLLRLADSIPRLEKEFVSAEDLLALGKDQPSLECLKACFEFRPDLALLADATGSTLLHRIDQKELLNPVLNALGSSADLDVRNSTGATPLMSAASRGSLGCCVKFLSHGASPDVSDSEGNTALHIAAKGGQTQLVKCLLVFGADWARPNSSGLTASQLAIQSGRQEVERCIQLFSSPPHSSFSAPDQPETRKFAQIVALSESLRRKKEVPKRTVNLLSLDGGGIRGLVLIQILLHLERRLGGTLTSHFGWLAGTSTGAILAIALAAGRSLRECQRTYFRFKDSVFCGVRPYDTSVLENFLKTEFGETKTMAEIVHTKVMVTTVRADRYPVELVVLRNYQFPLDSQQNLSLGCQRPESQLLWRSARCSSAAPTYFSSVDGKFVDGGLVSNNPSLDLLVDVQDFNNALRYSERAAETLNVGCLVSVGTGRVPTRQMSSLDLARPTNAIDAIAKAFAVKELGTLLIDQVTSAEGSPVDRTRAWCHSLQIPFFRFSPPLRTDIPLDEVDDDKLVSMLWETEMFLIEKRHQIQSLIDHLNAIVDD